VDTLKGGRGKHLYQGLVATTLGEAIPSGQVVDDNIQKTKRALVHISRANFGLKPEGYS